ACASQHQTFQKHACDHISTVRSQGCANGKLLTAAFHTHEQQVGYVRTRYEENNNNGSHQYPKHIADVADYINFERLETGGEICFFEHLQAESRWRRETVRGNWDQASQVGGGLLQSDSRLQPRQAVGTEAAKRRFTAINLPRYDHINIGTVHEHEVGGQYADNFMHLAIELERAADYRGIAAKMPLPGGVCEDDSKRHNRRFVSSSE